MVGFVMAAYGGTSIFSAVVMSYLEKYLRHRILFAMAAFFNINVYVAMILWKPNADNGLYSFLLAIPWGLAEGIWLAQSNGKNYNGNIIRVWKFVCSAMTHQYY